MPAKWVDGMRTISGACQATASNSGVVERVSRFAAAPGVTVKGLTRLLVTELGDHFSLYVAPINLDPESPAMPISHPPYYATYLAKKVGPYATLGLAEDTWALNERVIDEKAFFEQAMAIYDERERMFLDALAQTKKGLLTTVFDTTDRVQHMFYRYLDPTHPANAGKDTTLWADAIAQVYERADALLGRLWSEIEDLESEHDLPSTSMPDGGTAWMVHRWASGERLDAVLRGQDIAAGDFVRRCKQLVDLLDQVAKAATDEQLRRTARTAVDAVLRGVVAADRLD